MGNFTDLYVIVNIFDHADCPNDTVYLNVMLAQAALHGTSYEGLCESVNLQEYLIAVKEKCYYGNDIN